MNPAEIDNIARAERTLWWYRGQRRIFSRFVSPFLAGRTLSRVLEAGCGTGFESSRFESEYRWPMFPLDLDAGGLRRARAMGLTRLCQADLACLPYASGAFDAAVSLDVLVHFPRGAEATALAELSRVLRPGGLLLLRVSALDVLRSRHSIHVAERQRFTRAHLLAATSAAGIRPLRCSYANTLLLPVALFKFRVWETLVDSPPSSGVVPVPRWLDGLLHAPLAVEAVAIEAGANLPIGQSLLFAGQKT